MSYQIWLLSDTEQVEIESEDIEMNMLFSVADISDISVRKDSVKTISIKGTKNNNAAFGHLFNLSRTTDSTLSNKLFFNYNPLRTVQALVYEDSILVFKGLLRVSEIVVDKNGNAVYSCNITGGFIDFRDAIQDKLLTDLNFDDLRHRYSVTNLTNSWNTSTERWNGSTYSSAAFAFGAGYVYPSIDYGYIFNTVNGNKNVGDVHYKNFKPGIYVKEYLDRIFSQSVLPDYSYEVKGDAAFLDKFNKLILPNVDEGLTSIYKGFIVSMLKPTTLVSEINRIFNSPFTLSAGVQRVSGIEYQLLVCSSISALPAGSLSSLVRTYSTYNNVLECERSFNTNGNFSVQFETIQNTRFGAGAIGDFFVKVQIVERSPENNNTANSGWVVIGESSLMVPSSTTLTNQTISGDIGYRDYKRNNQLGIRIVIVGDTSVLYNEINNDVDAYYKVVSTRLTLPSNNYSNIKVDNEIGDVVTPSAPVTVKQIDFLKGLINLFNMYAFPDSVNPKKIIFQKYDDYYAYASPQYLATNSLDWSNKIDYKNGFKVKSNLSLPKAYSFMYKADEDFFNKIYKTKYNKVYGQKDFTDDLGLIESKKVELPFASTPMFSSGDRYVASLYVDKKVSKTNMKIMYYNGLVSCGDWSIFSESSTASVWSKTNLVTKQSYPLTSNYYYVAGVPVEDLNFDRPAEYYFTADINHQSALTSYQVYYQNQISELTNLNVNYYEVSACLNELDIANIDLQLPVFIDTGNNGNAYFKVLSVNYQANNIPSTVNLQRIVIDNSSVITTSTTTTTTTLVPPTIIDNLISDTIGSQTVGGFVFLSAHSALAVTSNVTVYLVVETQYQVYSTTRTIVTGNTNSVNSRVIFTSGNSDEAVDFSYVVSVSPSSDSTYNYTF